ncbi:MAG: hypothetical protein H7A41_08835 [Chlamydiales bacterium]|nr:hypothetical protein [Chlamydiia bacterium]MCP5505240.1 hypothetical protein [Chlamydiales bacterium]
MKKMVAQILLATTLSATLFAESMSERVERLEQEMKSVYNETPIGTAGAKFGNACPEPYQTTWFFTAEALYWHAKEGGTEYAIAFDSASLPMSGTVKDSDFDWDLGFRFGLGRFLGERKWDINLIYTHFYTSDTESTNEPNDSTIYVDETVGTSGGISHAKFDARVDYDSLDLMLGKGFFISKMISFHPKIGLKAAWIDQKFKLHASDRLDNSQTPFIVSGSIFHRLHSSSDFFGLGPRFGTDMTWFLADGFRLFADLSAALFYSNNDARFSNRIVILPDGEGETVVAVKVKGDKHHFSPQVAFFGGILWGTNFHIKNRDQYLELGFGYEAQYFWRVNQTLNISDAQPALSATGPVRIDFKRTSEDLSFYGLTFKARLDF